MRMRGKKEKTKKTTEKIFLEKKSSKLIESKEANDDGGGLKDADINTTEPGVVCYPTTEILQYWQEKISEKRKKEIERHVYGKECRSVVDECFGTKIDIHDGKGCKECFRKLARIVSIGSEALKHL